MKMPSTLRVLLCLAMMICFGQLYAQRTITTNKIKVRKSLELNGALTFDVDSLGAIANLYGDSLDVLAVRGGQTVKYRIPKTSAAASIDKLSSETTATVTASMFYILPVNSSAGPVTINPPVAPSSGDWFCVSDSRATADTNPITVDFITATQNLHGSAQNFILNTQAGFVRFTYVDATIGWIVSK